MKEHTFKVERAYICEIVGNQERVTLYTDLPHPQYRPATENRVTISFTCDKGTGFDFVEKEYGVTPIAMDFFGNIVGNSVIRPRG